MFSFASDVEAASTRLPDCCSAPGSYLVEGARRIKIGRARDVGRRIADLQIGSPVELKLIGLCRGDVEHFLHLCCSEFRLHGEWFKAGWVHRYLKRLSPLMRKHDYCLGLSDWYDFLSAVRIVFARRIRAQLGGML